MTQQQRSICKTQIEIVRARQVEAINKFAESKKPKPVCLKKLAKDIKSGEIKVVYDPDMMRCNSIYGHNSIGDLRQFLVPSPFEKRDEEVAAVSRRKAALLKQLDDYIFRLHNDVLLRDAANAAAEIEAFDKHDFTKGWDKA